MSSRYNDWANSNEQDGTSYAGVSAPTRTGDFAIIDCSALEADVDRGYSAGVDGHTHLT